MKEYSKHKERSPRETVFEIKRILNEAGLFPVMQWGVQAYTGARSNRVTLYPTTIGQNGKGTDELYASASGFAELMERMENSWLGQKTIPEELHQFGGFREFPDEKIMPITDVLDQDEPYLNDVFRQLGLTTYWQKLTLLQSFAQLYYHRDDGMINTAPYVDVFADRIVYIPFAVITLFSVSNGMTAGNTIEEALVQGFSEVYERYAHVRLLKGGITPPEVPRGELQKYSLWNLIEQVEADGRYRVSVRDCSMGKGYPVSMVIITDIQNGTFGAKIGCHPSFAISVERTLTEALQGRRMEQFAAMNHVGGQTELQSYHNLPNICKTGPGGYPPEVLVGKPSWEYRPWAAWEGLSNRAYLKRLVALAREEGFRPLIRNSSHMGFPAYHVLIPGIHSIYPVSQSRVREFWSMLRTGEAMNHFPDLSQEEEERLLTLILFKEGSVESALNMPLMHHFIGRTMSTVHIGAYLALKRGKFKDAHRLFILLFREETDEEARISLRAFADYCRFRSWGMNREEALAQIAYLSPENAARRVREITEDNDQLLRKVFPKLSCFDCANCPLKDHECEYPAAAEIQRKIKTAMSRSTVSQEAFRGELRELLKSE